MKPNLNFSYAIIIVGVVAFAVAAHTQLVNPFLKNPDPFVMRDNSTGNYYLLATKGTNITIYDGSTLQAVTSHAQTVFTPTDGMTEMWSPTLWHMDGRWWVYFTATYPHQQHKIYALRSLSENPLGSYTFQGPINTGRDSIAPSILTLHGNNYLMYVSVSGGFNGTWITALADPMTPTGKNTLLIYPDQSWERGAGTTDNYPVAEDPTVLYHNGKTFIVYSGSDTATPVYCLGLLTYKGKGEPTDSHNWTKIGPVFTANPAGGVYGPGRATFTKSPDGKQDWMIYHAKSSDALTAKGRDLRIQPFTWNKDGLPVFGIPVSTEPVSKLNNSHTKD